MKMKKGVLLFSMAAVLFSMTGCASGQETVNFEYTNTDIISNTVYQSYQLQNATDAYRAYLEDSEEETAGVLLTAVNNFDTAEEECGAFEGYRSTSGDSISFDLDSMSSAKDEESYYAALEEFSEFVGQIDATVEEDGSDVIVKLTAVHSNRDVIYTYVYEENTAYAYAYELYQQNVNPYQVKEVTAAPDYSMGEKMEKAAYNTLMGMATVFFVLIFIAFVIAQFDKINKITVALSESRNKSKNADLYVAEVQEAPVATAPVAVPETNPMDDSQLVAVITAAVVAANVATGGSDKLIVRSIRKAKR